MGMNCAGLPKATSWASFFLPWGVHPERRQAWYAAQRRDAYARTGIYDDLYEQYRETDDQALVPSRRGSGWRPQWEIAQRLIGERRTVYWYTAELRGKFGVGSTNELRVLMDEEK